MAEGLAMDSNLFETYHQRMAEIQDVSDVIAVSNMQLNKILSQFGWTRQSLLKKNELETCPLDENHKIHKDNLQTHIQTCTLRKHKILSVESKDIPLAPLHNPTCATFPVFTSKAQYKKAGVSIDEDTPNASSSTVEDVNILENDEGINEYKPCNSLDELRFIYSWHKIPKNYIILDITRLPKNELSNWLVENISITNLSDEVKGCIINSMLGWLTEFPTPLQIISHIQDVLGKNSKLFVLRLWKFLAAKCLCLNQQIPEHTRNEFDFYTTTSMSNQSSTVANEGITDKELAIESISPVLPMEWVRFNLTSEQKLAIYEDVCKTWKLLKKPLFGISELKMETLEQVKMLTEFDENAKGAKTHMEVLAELRDYKRRRQSYRGKNKSTRLMSGIDVLRELYNQQMLYLRLVHQNKQQHETENACEIEDSKSKSASPEKQLTQRSREEKGSNDRLKACEIEDSKSRSVSPEKQLRQRSREERGSNDRRRSLNRSRETKRSRSKERRRRSKSKDMRSRSRSRSRDRYHRSRSGRHRERSREISRYRDSRDRDDSHRRDSRSRGESYHQDSKDKDDSHNQDSKDIDESHRRDDEVSNKSYY